MLMSRASRTDGRSVSRSRTGGRTLSGTSASSAPSMISLMSCWSALGMAISTSSAR